MFSKRLLEIASLVPVHSTVVDVGCDHGLLDIYLTLHRNCKCTASDINENCLKSARENIKKYSLVDKIKVVKSDGLNDVKYNKTDYIVQENQKKIFLLFWRKRELKETENEENNS